MMLSGDNGILQRAASTKELNDVAKIEEQLKLSYMDTLMSKMTSGYGQRVSTADWMFKMIDDGWTVTIEPTDIEDEYIVSIDQEDDIYIYNTTTNKLSKYNKRFTDNWYNEYTYTTDDSENTITLTKYNGEDKVAYVGEKAKIGTKEYNTIIQGTSSSTIFGGTSATHVKIQSGITEIGNYAFYNNTNLKSIILPDGVTTIGNQAFSGSFTNLELVYIPSGVSEVTYGSFSGVQSLKTIVIGSTNIYGAFSQCSQLENIKFLEGVEEITNGAFSASSNPNQVLKELVFPSTIRIVRNSAFQNYTGLKKVVLPSGSQETGGSAFGGCSNLEELIIGTKVITDSAFSHLEKLKKIEFLEGVESIIGASFNGCSMIKSINLPNGVKTIGPGCFSSCTALTEITIPDSIETIDNYAFTLSEFLDTTLHTTSEVALNFNWVSVKRKIIQPLQVNGTNIKNVADLSTLYGQVTNYKSLSHPSIVWQLFYDDPTNVYLIASDYVPNSELPCSGNTINGVTYGDTDLIKVSNSTYGAVFHDSSTNKGILTPGTIYKDGVESTAITSNPLVSTYYKWVNYISGYQYYNSVAKSDKACKVSYMMDTNKWSSFADGISGAFAMGGPTVEMFALSWNRVAGHSQMTSYETLISDSNIRYEGYFVNGFSEAYWYPTSQEVSGNANKMWFLQSEEKAYGYWLASPSGMSQGMGGPTCVVTVASTYLDSYNTSEQQRTGFRPLIAVPRSSLP